MFLRSPDTQNNWINVSVYLLLAIALLFRILALGTIPGINGDEAWYGIIALNILDGDFSTLITRHGNILNPFYIIPLIVLHLGFEPSFTLLRITPLVSGLLLIYLSYSLSVKIIDRKTALIIMLIVACLPVNIAYSRFGWDTSQSVLVSIIVIYALLSDKWKTLALSIIAAIIIHPTNAALLLISILYITINWLLADRNTISKKTILICMAVFLTWGAFFVANQELVKIWLPVLNEVSMIDRNLSAAGEFFLNISRLLSGTTIYQFISGGGDLVLIEIFDLVLAFVLSVILSVLLVTSYLDKDNKVFSFVLAFMLTLGVWYILFSSFPLRPGTERYSLFIIMPITICTGFLCRKLMLHVRYGVVFAGIVVFCALMLSGFAYNYFYFIHNTGGQSESTFKTNYLEPKKMVFDKVIDQILDSKITLLTSQWWNSKPLIYLAYKNKKINIIDISSSSDLVQISNNQKLFINTFVNDDLDTYVIDELYLEIDNSWAFNTFSGEPLMMLYEMKPLELDLYLKR